MDEAEWRRAFANQRTRQEHEQVIPLATWEAAQSATAEVDREGPLCFGVDVHPERTSAAIAASDGRIIELIEHRDGVGWLIERAKALSEKWGGRFAVDGGGPAGTLAQDLREAGLAVVELGLGDLARGCARLYDGLADGRLTVRTSPALDLAVQGLAKRPVGDRWVWSRHTSQTDATPIMAATIALAVAPEKPFEPLAAWT